MAFLLFYFLRKIIYAKGLQNGKKAGILKNKKG